MESRVASGGQILGMDPFYFQTCEGLKLNKRTSSFGRDAASRKSSGARAEPGRQCRDDTAQHRGFQLINITPVPVRPNPPMVVAVINDEIMAMVMVVTPVIPGLVRSRCRGNQCAEHQHDPQKK